MPTRLRALTLAAGLAGVLVVGVVVARAQAQSPTPSPPSPACAEFLALLAQNLGVSPETLQQALTQTVLQSVHLAVDRGALPPEQAQQVQARLSGGIPGIGLAPCGDGPSPLAPGSGPTPADLLPPPPLVAQFLGITLPQLQDELDGRSLAQVAQAHGKSRDELKQFLLSIAQQRLAEAVQQGHLQPPQAMQILAMLAAQVDRGIDQVQHR